MLLLVVAPSLIGCVRVRASITVSPDDRVSGQIVAAAIPRDDDDKGPQLLNNLPFAQKVAVSDYSRDDYVGSQAVFSDLTFAELPQLASMNRDAAGVDISLRRAGDLVILEGRVDLTSLSDPEADVSLSVSFPGEVHLDQRRPDLVHGRRVEAAPRRRQHDERPGPLHRPQRPVVHRRRDLARDRIAAGRRRRGVVGLRQPGPFAQARRHRRTRHTSPDLLASGQHALR